MSAQASAAAAVRASHLIQCFDEVRAAGHLSDWSTTRLLDWLETVMDGRSSREVVNLARQEAGSCPYCGRHPEHEHRSNPVCGVDGCPCVGGH